MSGRLPVLIGSGQLSYRAGTEGSPGATPLDLLEAAASSAVDDCGARAAMERIDTVVSLHGWPWGSAEPGRELADAMGIHPVRTARAAGGGQTGVYALNWAAEEILAGRSQAVLLASVNFMRSYDQAARLGTPLDLPGRITEEPPEIGSFRLDGTSPEEEAVGLDRPVHVYPLFENALRAWRGQTLDEHRRYMGRLFAPFTEVAAANPAAWFPVARGAEELVTVTEANRMIGFPYPKYLNAVLSTDQAAAVIIASSEWADAAGVERDRRVFWWGGAAATETAWHVSTRRDLAYSPAMDLCHRTALMNAGVGVDDIAAFDFYSCFPAAVEMAVRVLGIDAADTRPFTVTGGLPYAGGPGSGYTVHSLASMLHVLRGDPGRLGMVTGNGWYLTKHSATVLSSEPPRAARPGAATAEVVAAMGEAATPLEVRRGSGPGCLDSYTVVHDRDGRPAKGVVVGRFGDGTRFVADTEPDRDLLQSMEEQEMVGVCGVVTDSGAPALRFHPD